MTALKTISMRIRGAKTELADAGLETEGMAESTAKLREEIMALSGVDIMLDKNTFKSTYQIMEELAGKWEQLTDIQQASVTELIAGKRQGNIVSSLMTNFDVAQDALQTSLNSSGSAMREHEKWMQSLEAKLLQLKAAWQGLSQAFMSSDFLKGALDGLINFLEILTKLIDTIGVIPTLLAGVGLFKLGKKGLGSLFGFKQTEVGVLIEIAKAMGVLGDNAGKSAGLIGRAGSALKGMAGEAGGAGAALKGVGKSLLGIITKHPVIAAVAIAITAVTAAIMYQKKKAEELSEEVDELTSKYQEQHSTLMQNKGDFDTSNASSLASRYKELSKGVDGLGRNISLTADEYAEYQSVCNSIAEQIPSLVSGYDEQGNAILTCAGNVDELTAAYQRLIHEQNQDILINAGNIEKDFSNTLKGQSGEHWWADNHGFWKGLAKGFYVEDLLGVDYELKTDTAERLQSLLDANKASEKNKIFKELKKDAFAVEEINTALRNSGIDVGAFENPIDVLEETYNEDPQKIKGIVEGYFATFDEAIDQQKTIAEAKLSEAFDIDAAISGMDYSGISENLQAVAHGVVNSFDYDFLSQLSEQGISVESWVTDMLDQLNAISKADSAEIDAAFNLQTKFNDNQISYGGYVDQIKDISNTIDSLNVSDEVKSQIKLALNTEEVIEQYDALSKKLTSEKYDIQLETKEAEAFLNSLTSEELSVLTQIIPELSKNGVNETVDDLRAEIEKAMAMNPPTIDIAVETERLETLTSAITESLSGVGLSGEATTAIESMFSNLGSYDASKLFERTANGIRLNSDELRRLNNEYADTNMSALNNKMSDLGDLYAETQLELAGLTYGTEEYNQKAGELSAIEAQINSVETLATQYKGLTSAYNQWQQAEAAGQQRDMYESVISGLENIDDEISRGWVDDATIEFLELLSGQDLSTAGIDKIKKAYKGLDDTIKNTTYSVRDFFTVDDEGNSTNAGVYNFLDAVGQLEEEKFGGKDIVQRDKKGNIIGFDFKIAGGDEVIAEALGVSEELVQIMVRAADDAGFVVSMDGTYQQLDILKEKAQKAAESLKGIMGEDGVDFNFNASTIEEITPQLKEAEKILDSFRNKDGSINLEMEGAEEAFTVASTLQSMLDKLTRPAYMDIQTSQVDKELQKPLENLQEYRRLVETEHQLKLSGADTTELEKSKSEIIDYFEDIQANNPELAVELGIDGDSRKELEKKISEGEFEIPATVDIQMEMDDKLGILVDKALLEAGIIDKKEFKKRVDVYLDADVDNKDAKSKTEKAVKEVADGKSGKSNKDGKSSGKKVKKNVDVEVKADKVDTSDVKKKTNDAVKKDVPTGADGRKMGMGVDVKVEAKEVDASDVSEKTKDAVEKASKETSKIGKEVDLEVTIDEYKEVIQGLEKADRDIVIDVKVKGLNDVKELNKNIDLATKIDGDIDNLSEFVEGAKALSKLDNDITNNVTANIYGNVIDTRENKLEKLKVFGDNAKGLKNIGIITSNVAANVEGNVLTTREGKLDNLKVFCDSAKNIGKVGSATSKVTANVKGNVINTKESKLERLKVFYNSAKNIGKIGSFTSDVTANVDGNVIDTGNKKLERLKVFYNSAKNVGKIGKVTSKVIANAEGNVLTTREGKLDNLKVFYNSAKNVGKIGKVEAKVTADVDGSVLNTREGKIEKLKLFTDSAENIKKIGKVEAKVTANVDGDVLDTRKGKIKKLKTFSDSAQNLKKIGKVTSEIVANVDGDVLDTKKSKIEKLKLFSDSAQNLKKIGKVESSITADVEGSVLDTRKGKIEKLKIFSDSAKNIKKIGKVEANVTADVEGSVLTTREGKLDNLKVFYNSAKNVRKIGKVISKVTADVEGSVINTREGKLERLKIFSDSANELKGVGDIVSNVNANIDGNITDNNVEILNKFANAATAVKSIGKVVIKVAASVASDTIKNAIDLLKKVSESGVFKNYSANVKVTTSIDSTAVTNYQPPKKTGTVIWKNNTAKIDEFKKQEHTATGKVNWGNNTKKVKKSFKAQGTVTWTSGNNVKVKVVKLAKGTAYTEGSANSNGSASGRAFAHGNWGIKGNGVALGGELGQELVVRNGRFFTIGDNGAEFFQYKKNDIVFNAAQTASLFKYGGIKGADPRGKVFASGTAFAEGRAFSVSSTGSTGSGGGWGRVDGGSSSGSGSSSSKTSSKKSSSKKSSTKKTSKKSSDKFEETIDWIEVAIDRIERAIDRLDLKASSIYKKWSTRNSALVSEIDKVREEIDLQQRAYDRYIKEADSVGLSSSYAEKVRNGKIDIEDITSESLKEKIDEYQEW